MKKMESLKMIWKKISSVYFCFFIAATGCRFLSILQLYLMPTPEGGELSDTRTLALIFKSTAADAGTYAIILGLFGLLTVLLKKQSSRFIPFVALAFCSIYFFCSVCDNEIIRWINQRLTLDFVNTYKDSISSLHLVLNIFQGGWESFVLHLFWLVLFVFLCIILQKKQKEKSFSKISLISLFVIGAIALTYAFVLPQKGRQCRERIQPFYVHIGKELLYQHLHNEIPENYEIGIKFLGGDPSKKYPFYKEVTLDSSVVTPEQFAHKTMDEKPDIILFTIESWRGWVGDVRLEKNCALLPNLCKLKKQGIFFPYTYSAGWPSTEGLNGMMRGIWSHPVKYFSGYKTNARTLPDILGEAGYYRLVLPTANPNFDGFTPYFQAWFDSTDYHSEIHEDIPLANRFVEIYNNRPKDKPIFIDWMSGSTHSPFIYPKSLGKTPKDFDERYERLAKYLDDAIGIVLEAVAKSDRANNTIFIVTGDHSFSTGVQRSKYTEVGSAHSGRLWTTLLLAGPGIPADSVNTNPISHVDLAPTLLSVLGIQTSNNFVGYNILDSLYVSRVISFTEEDAALRVLDHQLHVNALDPKKLITLNQEQFAQWDTTQIVKGFVGEDVVAHSELDIEMAKQLRAAEKAWQYVLDHDLLIPLQ